MLLTEKDLRHCVFSKIYSGWWNGVRYILSGCQQGKMLHFNEQSAKSAGRLLEIHTGSRGLCSGSDCVWKNTVLPLPVFNEVNCKKVAKTQSNSEENWKGNTGLPFCAASSSAEKRRMFVVFALKKSGVTLAGTQIHKHRLPTNALLF